MWLWVGLCPTESGRRRAAHATDPPYNSLERDRLSSPPPLQPVWRGKGTRPGHIMSDGASVNPGVCAFIPASPSPGITLQPGRPVSVPENGEHRDHDRVPVLASP